MKRRGYDVFYHADKKECDFVVREGMRIKEAYQVNLPLLGMRKFEAKMPSPSKLIEVALGSMQYVLSYITYELNECD